MYWKNSDFQILNFIVGKCFTADEAYRQLKQLKEDRDLALVEYKAFKIETEAKVEYLKSLQISSPYEEAKNKADLIRTESALQHSNSCYEAALHELEFIEELMRRVDQYREFKHLSDSEAFQLSQAAEWEQKLIHKARLSLLCSGSIEPELLDTMMSHPNWNSTIRPELDRIRMMDSAKLTTTDKPLLKMLSA